jgi:nucleoside 2-deoxyribosyltransferase
MMMVDAGFPLKVYYSHCMKTYWTEVEMKEMAIIKKEFPDAEIVNPPSFEDSSKKQIEGMAFCHRLIDQCDILVFSRLLDVITSGVGDEVNYALGRNKRVFEIKNGCLNPCCEPVKYVSRAQTLRIYRLIEMDPALKRRVTEQ